METTKVKKVSKKFAYVIKKQYLCSRFESRPEKKYYKNGRRTLLSPWYSFGFYR